MAGSSGPKLGPGTVFIKLVRVEVRRMCQVGNVTDWAKSYRIALPGNSFRPQYIKYLNAFYYCSKKDLISL